jgi:hypothetical protein
MHNYFVDDDSFVMITLTILIMISEVWKKKILVTENNLYIYIEIIKWLCFKFM